MSDRYDFETVIRILLQNALDEAAAGHATAIDVELFEDAVRVTDDGRGLPVHSHPQSGRSLMEVILTGPRRGPKKSLALVTTHCLWIEAEVHRDGELWFQRYEMALPTSPPAKRGTATRHGTTITAAPAVGEPPGFERLMSLVRNLCFDRGQPKVKVRVRDRRVQRDETIEV